MEQELKKIKVKNASILGSYLKKYLQNKFHLKKSIQANKMADAKTIPSFYRHYLNQRFEIA